MKKQFVYKHLPIFFLWLLVIFYILLCQFAVGMGGDDWFYRNTTWANIVPEALREYMVTNPRLPATMLTRVYSLSPWYLVDIANTVVFFGLCYLLLRLTLGTAWKNALKRWETPLFLTVLLLYVVPLSGGLFYWHCGVASYGWPLIYNFTLLLWLRKIVVEKDAVGSWVKVWLFGAPLALLAAMGMYSIGGLSFLATIAALYILKKRANDDDFKKLSVIAVVLLIGLVAVVVAPGNYHRIDMVNASAGDAVKGVALKTAQSPQARFWRVLPGVLPGLLLMLVMASVFIKRCLQRSWTKDDVIYIAFCVGSAIIMAIPVLLLPVKAPSRAYAGCYIMALLVAVRLMLTGPSLGRFGTYMFRAALLVPVLLAATALPSQWDTYQWWLKVEKHIDQPACKTYEMPYNPADSIYCGPRHFWYNDMLKNFNAGEVTENPVRCFYSGTVGEVTVKGDLTEEPLRYLCDDFVDPNLAGTLRLELTGMEDTVLPDSVAVAYYVTPSTAPYIGKAHELWANAVQADTVSRAELEKQPHWVIQTAEKQDGAYVLKWEDYPASLKRPKCPDIWVAIPDASGQQVFHRISAKPSWR